MRNLDECLAKSRHNLVRFGYNSVTIDAEGDDEVMLLINSMADEASAYVIENPTMFMKAFKVLLHHISSLSLKDLDQIEAVNLISRDLNLKKTDAALVLKALEIEGWIVYLWIFLFVGARGRLLLVREPRWSSKIKMLNEKRILGSTSNRECVHSLDASNGLHRGRKKIVKFRKRLHILVHIFI